MMHDATVNLNQVCFGFDLSTAEVEGLKRCHYYDVEGKQGTDDLSEAVSAYVQDNLYDIIEVYLKDRLVNFY